MYSSSLCNKKHVFKANTRKTYIGTHNKNFDVRLAKLLNVFACLEKQRGILLELMPDIEN